MIIIRHKGLLLVFLILAFFLFLIGKNYHNNYSPLIGYILMQKNIAMGNIDFYAIKFEDASDGPLAYDMMDDEVHEEKIDYQTYNGVADVDKERTIKKEYRKMTFDWDGEEKHFLLIVPKDDKAFLQKAKTLFKENGYKVSSIEKAENDL